MEVFHCTRDEAIEQLRPFEATTEDKQYANFLVDLFTHHKFDHDRFERAFWRDNAVMAQSSHPQWSLKQRECIERMQNRWLSRMVGRPI